VAGGSAPVLNNNEIITISNNYDTTTTGKFYAAGNSTYFKYIQGGWNVETYGNGRSGYMIKGVSGICGYTGDSRTEITCGTGDTIYFGGLNQNGFVSASATLTAFGQINSVGLTVGSTSASGQIISKILTASGGSNKAPVISLFRTGAREGVIAIDGSSNLIIANTGGIADYNDATLTAAANLTISNTGNVAIGKTSPINAKLDVSGSAIISGSLSVTSAVSISNTTAGSSNAGALVVQGGISAGNNASAASYFGGAVAVTGEITATGNITAYYSDDRLKNNLGNIPNSLNKVLSLNGFYFEPNQTAIDLGYTKQKEIGVSAQQVQAILPEIIAPAPIDAQYMTVRYEKLIPLLIEAIKEQNIEIEKLKVKISILEK